MNIVWLKRDLRTHDHLPFHHAEKDLTPYLPIFIFEPSIINHPDTSLRHLQFQYHSLLEMQKKLQSSGIQVQIFYGEAAEVFSFLHQKFTIHKVFSYQESGIPITFERDKQLAKFFEEKGIEWIEFQRDGIIRGLKNRKNWDKKWTHTMESPIVINRFRMHEPIECDHPFYIPEHLKKSWSEYSKDFQPAGEDYAWKYLQSFVTERGRNYMKHISKPEESRLSCSRLSPYLSWGNISSRQVYQFVKEAMQRMRNPFPFQNFITRLVWRCHFVQKFEMECRYETECINRGYEKLEHTRNEDFIRAWEEGKTGYPLVDACMRCLHQTGWINFRMRAMLVSFFCHYLNQDWRWGVYHLARLFLDYEPGIHYPQFQMQAGTTGVNLVRIYNPIKQSMEHDPHGVFIKKWVPELRNVPEAYIHEPHKMPLFEQNLIGFTPGKDYPLPIVDPNLAPKTARDKIWGLRKDPEVIAENERILSTHVQRRERRG